MLVLSISNDEWIEFRIGGELVKIAKHKDKSNKVIIEAPRSVDIGRSKRVEGE